MENEKNPFVYPFEERRDIESMNPGITLRDHFAGLAMQTILGQKYFDGTPLHVLNYKDFIPHSFGESEPTEQEIQSAKDAVQRTAEKIAEMSVIMANAMLQQRLTPTQDGK